MVEKVCPRFALLKTEHYRTTVHYTDLLIGAAKVEPVRGAERDRKVVWLPENWERTEQASKKAAAK